MILFQSSNLFFWNWKNKNKKNDICAFVLALIPRLYSKTFRDLHKKTPTPSKVGADLKIAIKEKQSRQVSII
jgi:hypothetical protein